MLGTLCLPLSAHELRDAVREARRFDPARLDRVLRHDARLDHVEVQASASWASLSSHLHPHAEQSPGFWPEAATIGATVAANAAGHDGRPVVAHVEALALVTADGELRRISRHANSELFKLTVGGQGLFGVPYSITLRCESLSRAASASDAPAMLALPSAKASARPLELLLPPPGLPRFLDEARELCAEWRTAIKTVSVRHTQAEGETVLRWARREYAATTLVLEELATIGGSVRVTQLHRALIDKAILHGGSFAIACTREATREQTETCYPELKQILAEKRRMDPAEKLANDWYRHYRSLLGRDACAVRWNR
jgi:hypothetical protein